MTFIKGHPNYLKYHSEETKKKISESHKGKKLSAEHRKNISLSHRSPRPWSKGENSPVWKGGKPKCLDCNKQLKDHRSIRCGHCAQSGLNSSHWGTKRSLEARLKTSLANKGNPKCASMKGKKHTIKTRLKMSQIQKERVAQGLHNLWKGGIDKAKHSERYALMKTMEYKLWREAVFKRDNFTCQMCNQHGGYLEADHIKSWNSYPELRFAIDNGRTLCRSCHQTTDTWGGRSSLKGGIPLRAAYA